MVFRCRSSSWPILLQNPPCTTTIFTAIWHLASHKRVSQSPAQLHTLRASTGHVHFVRARWIWKNTKPVGLCQHNVFRCAQTSTWLMANTPSNPTRLTRTCLFISCHLFPDRPRAFRKGVGWCEPPGTWFVERCVKELVRESGRASN